MMTRAVVLKAVEMGGDLAAWESPGAPLKRNWNFLSFPGAIIQIDKPRQEAEVLKTE